MFIFHDLFHISAFAFSLDRSQVIVANNDGDVVNKVTIGEGSHPENVKVYGPGVEKTGLKANEPTYFTVDCSEAGQGETCFMSNGLFSCPATTMHDT